MRTGRSRRTGNDGREGQGREGGDEDGVQRRGGRVRRAAESHLDFPSGGPWHRKLYSVRIAASPEGSPFPLTTRSHFGPPAVPT